MNKLYYPAVFHPEEVGYSVSVPDLAGCFTQGDTMDEALDMVQDAIGLMLDGCTEYPAASDPGSIRPEPGDFVLMVAFDALDYKRRTDNRAVKKTLTIPSWLNQAAEAAHINFSGVLQEALKSKLNIG
jgi:predicted RNase H-like HicB family nuclease